MEMLFPYNDTVTRSLTLDIAVKETNVKNVEIRPNGTAHVTSLTYYKYLAATDDAAAYLITSDREWGVTGRVAINDHVGEISTLSDSAELTSLPAPSERTVSGDDLFLVEFVYGTAALPGPCYVVMSLSWTATAAGTSSDCDGGGGGGGGSGEDDDPDTITHKFVMIGEGKWCETRQADPDEDWGVELGELADSVKSGFSDTKADMVYDAVVCHNEFVDLDHAKRCDGPDGWVYTDCYYNDAHAYPFTTCDANAYCYANQTWWDIDHGRDHDWYTFDKVDVAHVIHKGLMHKPSGKSVCGLAYFSNGGEDRAGAGVSTDWTRDSNCADWVATHEIGHNFNAKHEYADEADCTVMVSGGCSDESRDNHFSTTNREDRVDPCAEDPDCPIAERK